MTTHGKRLTTTDIPKKGDCIIANGKTYFALADAYWHPNNDLEWYERDAMGEWIAFHVIDKDEWHNPNEVIDFGQMLVCKCHAEGKELFLFWDGQPSSDITQKGKAMWDEILPCNAWTTFS